MAKLYTSVSIDKEVAEQAKQAAAGGLLSPTFSEVVEAGLKLFIEHSGKLQKRQKREAARQ